MKIEDWSTLWSKVLSLIACWVFATRVSLWMVVTFDYSMTLKALSYSSIAYLSFLWLPGCFSLLASSSSFIESLLFFFPYPTRRMKFSH